MKKHSIRPVVTAVAAAACLLPLALHAQTTLQAPGGRLGESTAQPMGQPMGESMAVPMVVPMSPAQSISQPYSPVSSGVAEQREGLQFRAMAGVERDDNVLRANAGKISDTITGLGLGLRYQKRVSRQQFVVDAEVNHFNFDKLGSDYNTLNYSAAWQWQAGERLEGILSADRRQFRDVTSDNLVTGIDRRTERNELFEAGYKLGASWRVLGGLQHNATRSSDPASWDGSLSQNSARVGVAYEPASGSSLALRLRRGNGDYSNAPVASDFDDNEIEASMRWIVSPKTRVDARLAHLDREHSGAPGRDFSGVVGSLGVNWDITGKTSLNAGYARDLGSYLFGTSGHLASNRWWVGPTWRATELITVNLRYEHETRNWEDVTGSLDIGRKDKFNVGTLGVEWAVRRSVTLGAQYRHERRSSSLPVFNYRANVIGLTAKLTI